MQPNLTRAKHQIKEFKTQKFHQAINSKEDEIWYGKF